MKIVCAWCGTLIGYKCPFCGQPLTEPTTPKCARRYMVCTSEPTQIYFAVSNMKTTSTICNACNARLAADRLNGRKEGQQ